MRLAGLGQLEKVFQVRSQLGEQRTDSAPTTAMSLGFRGVDDHSPCGEVDIRPFERRAFAGHSESAVAGQCDDRSPLRVGSRFDAIVDNFSIDEVLPLLIGKYRAGQVLERVVVDQSLFNRRIKELLGFAGSAADRAVSDRGSVFVAGVALGREVNSPLRRVGFGDRF